MCAKGILPFSFSDLNADACLEPVTAAVRSILGVLTPAEALPRAKAAAIKALELDSTRPLRGDRTTLAQARKIDRT